MSSSHNEGGKVPPKRDERGFEERMMSDEGCNGLRTKRERKRYVLFLVKTSQPTNNHLS